VSSLLLVKKIRTKVKDYDCLQAKHYCTVLTDNRRVRYIASEDLQVQIRR